MSFGQSNQGPANFFFPKGENGVFGVHVLQVVGSGIFGNRNVPPTGLPTGFGSGGVPDVSATYLGTGIFDLRFPVTNHVDISPTVSSQSGYLFHAQANDVSGPSGSAQLQITRLGTPGGAPSGYSPLQASGFGGFLPTGTRVMLSFFAAPNRNGLTEF